MLKHMVNYSRAAGNGRRLAPLGTYHRGCPLFVCPLGKGDLLMVTHAELYQFCIVIISVIGLVMAFYAKK